MDICPFSKEKYKNGEKGEKRILDYQLAKQILLSDNFRTSNIEEFDEQTNSFFLALSLSNELELPRLKKVISSYFTKKKVDYFSSQYFEVIFKDVLERCLNKKKFKLKEDYIFPAFKKIVYLILGIDSDKGLELTTAVSLIHNSQNNMHNSSDIYKYIFYELKSLLENLEFEENGFISYLNSNDSITLNEKVTFIYPFIEMLALEYTIDLPTKAILNMEKNPKLKDKLLANPTLFTLVFEESARLLDNVKITRYTNEDLQIEGVKLNRSEKIDILLSDIHRSDIFFEEALKFDIFRVNLKESLAFGLGEHQCLGKNLMLELSKKCCFQLIAYKYSLIVDNDSTIFVKIGESFGEV